MLCHPLRKSFQFWIQSTNQSSGHDGINLTAWKAFIAGSRDWKLKVMKVMTAMKAMKAYLKPIWSLFEGNEGNEGLSRQWRPWRPWRPWEREIPGIFRFSPGSWIVHLISTSSQKDPKHSSSTSQMFPHPSSTLMHCGILWNQSTNHACVNFWRLCGDLEKRANQRIHCESVRSIVEQHLNHVHPCDSIHFEPFNLVWFFEAAGIEVGVGHHRFQGAQGLLPGN